MAAHPLPPLITPEQYLEVERAAEFKSEYYEGQMFAMSGGRLAHTILQTQLAAALIDALRGRRCKVASSDLRVRAAAGGPFYYPDLSVYCGTAQLADEHRDTLVNPLVVFEVLSDSSASYDRGLKFDAYRKIETLQEYVLVWQTEPRIEVWRRPTEGVWRGSYYVGMDAVCALESLDCSIRLGDVYHDIPFESN
jgi:Uma2 family endonuclease